jgi:hypothetical protein
MKIQSAGYAAPPAAPCSACMDNGTSLANKCKQMIDCLGASWPCTGNCETSCLNQIGGNFVLEACVSNLTAAACQ